LGTKVFTLETWDYIFQTALRSRVNTMIVGTIPFADEHSLDLASYRGLNIITHHFNILGENTFRWPQGVPFSFGSSPEIMEYVWQVCVQAAVNRNSFWVLGYRGLNDYPFWIDDPEYNTPQKRGALISAAMLKEKEVVQTVYGNSSFFCIFMGRVIRSLSWWLFTTS